MNFYILSQVSTRQSFCLLKGLCRQAISVQLKSKVGWIPDVEPVGVEDHLYSVTLYEGLEHPQILVPAVGAGGVLESVPTGTKGRLYAWGHCPQLHYTQPSSVPRSHQCLPTSVNPSGSDRKTMGSFWTLPCLMDCATVDQFFPPNVSWIHCTFSISDASTLVLILANPIPELWKASLHTILQRIGRFLSHILGKNKCPCSTRVFHWVHRK